MTAPGVLRMAGGRATARSPRLGASSGSFVGAQSGMWAGAMTAAPRRRRRARAQDSTLRMAGGEGSMGSSGLQLPAAVLRICTASL